MAFALDLSDSLLLFRVRCAPESKDPSLGFQGFISWMKGNRFFIAKRLETGAEILKSEKKFEKRRFVY